MHFFYGKFLIAIGDAGISWKFFKKTWKTKELRNIWKSCKLLWKSNVCQKNWKILGNFKKFQENSKNCPTFPHIPAILKNPLIYEKLSKSS